MTEPQYPTRARGTVLDRAYHASRAACETALSLGRGESAGDLERGIVRPVAVDGDGPGLVCEAIETERRVGVMGEAVGTALREAADERAWTGLGWLLDPAESSSERVRRTLVVEQCGDEWRLRVGTERDRPVVVVLGSEVIAVLQRELRALGASEWMESPGRTSEQSSTRPHDAV